MVQKHIVYIIGFMGSGKTTAGKKLATTLDWSFIDLDKKIEMHAGKSIPEIFAREGEGYFREQESFLLKTLRSAANTIISTGGGAPCYSDNMDFMLETGITLYLKMRPEDLMTRLAHSQGDRPLIKEINKADLKSYIEEKLIEREIFYNRSHIITDGADPNITELSSLIKKMLKS